MDLTCQSLTFKNLLHAVHHSLSQDDLLAALDLAKSAVSKESNCTDIGVLEIYAALLELSGDLTGSLYYARLMVKYDKANCRGYLRTSRILSRKNLPSTALNALQHGLKNTLWNDPLYSILRGVHDYLSLHVHDNKRYDPIVRLPYDILHCIFSYLNFCQLALCLCVSKTWKLFFTTAPYLWTRLDFPTSRCRYTHSLSQFTASFLARPIRPNVHTLSIYHVPKQSGIVCSYLNGCTTLRQLHLFGDGHINEFTYIRLHRACERLNDLELTIQITDDQLNRLLYNGKNCLRKVHMHKVVNSGEIINWDFPMPELEYFRCNILHNCNKRSTDLRELWKGAIKLKTIILTGHFGHETTRGIEFRQNTVLEHIRITHGFFPYLPMSIRSLSFSGSPVSGLQERAFDALDSAYFPQLRQLVLINVPLRMAQLDKFLRADKPAHHSISINITSSPLQASNGHNPSTLDMLNENGETVISETGKIDSGGPLLRELSLTFSERGLCDDYNGTLLVQILCMRQLSKVERLCLDGCKITDETIDTICASLHGMESLSVAQTEISGAGALKLAYHFGITGRTNENLCYDHITDYCTAGGLINSGRIVLLASRVSGLGSLERVTQAIPLLLNGLCFGVNVGIDGHLINMDFLARKYSRQYVIERLRNAILIDDWLNQDWDPVLGYFNAQQREYTQGDSSANQHHKRPTGVEGTQVMVNARLQQGKCINGHARNDINMNPPVVMRTKKLKTNKDSGVWCNHEDTQKHTQRGRSCNCGGDKGLYERPRLRVERIPVCLPGVHTKFKQWATAQNKDKPTSVGAKLNRIFHCIEETIEVSTSESWTLARLSLPECVEWLEWLGKGSIKGIEPQFYRERPCETGPTQINNSTEKRTSILKRINLTKCPQVSVDVRRKLEYLGISLNAENTATAKWQLFE